MALRFSCVSISIAVAATACSLFAPSDSEFLGPGASGMGAAGAGAATMGGTAGKGGSGLGTSATGGEGGAPVDAALGAGGTGVLDAGGGAGSGHGGSEGSGPAGRGGAVGVGGAAASGAMSGSSGSSNSDSGADGSGCIPRLVYDFESGSLAGVASDFPLDVRTFEGSRALALDIGQLNAVSYLTFTLSICATGSADLRAKVLSFRTYFQGVPSSTGELVLQVWLPGRPASAAAVGGATPSTGAWTNFSALLAESDFSGATSTIMVEVASTGVQFSGTIWFDDFRIQ